MKTRRNNEAERSSTSGKDERSLSAAEAGGVEIVDVEIGGLNQQAHPPPPPNSQLRRPLTLTFAEVTFKIKLNGKRPHENACSGICARKSSSASSSSLPTEKTILHGVSGMVRPGEMMAMLGPSGSGKTTLLTALGGRHGSGRLSGSIAYNGRPLSSALTRNIGFVTQDDVLYAHLTVTETLVFTALLRLPRSLSRQQKVDQAEAVIAELGLSGCRDSIIGGGMVRGVSGGERKRVSIGQEMLINPSLLLLDEPTSGLDSTTAGRIVSTLQKLASEGGRTVVTTIHQPSSRIFHMFHKVLLLSDGRPLYLGSVSKVMDYFASAGYAPSVPTNPADFLLDLANGVYQNSDTDSDKKRIKDALVVAAHSHQAELAEEIRRVIGSMKGTELADKKARNTEDDGWCTSWWEQVRVLLRRDLKERRHEAFSIFKVAQILAISLLCGFLWFQSSGHLQDQAGLLFFMVGFWNMFPVYQAIFTFPQERRMLTKERSSRMYRLSSYFIARNVVDLPMELILPALSTTIIYWMAALSPAASSYFSLLLATLLSVLVAQGIGLAMGAVIMELKAATTAASIVMLTFMLAGGFYVQKVPPFLSWIKYLSPSYYTFKLQIASQFSPAETFECSPGVICSVSDYPPIHVVGFGHAALAVAALLAMLLFYRVIAYLGLRRVGAAMH